MRVSRMSDDGDIVGVTYPTDPNTIGDATKYGTLDGLSTTLQPALISVRDEDATSANSSTLDFTNFVNPSSSVTLRRGLDRLWYYFDADPGQNEVISPVVQQSGTYYLVVDGFSGANGTGTITGYTTPFATDASTIALYHLDEGTGQVLTDASGNNRNGVLGTSSAVETVDAQWSTDAPVH
jgi:hypothetical protein